MAHFDGTYSCGHEGEVSIPGTRKTGEYRAKMIFSGLCPDCQAAADEKLVDELKEKYSSPDSDLPMLEGSVKQIVWAESLRASRMNQVDYLVKKIKNFYDDEGIKLALLAIQKIFQISSSRWWIDHRDYDLDYMVENYLRDYGDDMKDEMAMEVLQQEATFDAAPKELHTSVVATIQFDDNEVRISSGKDEIIRGVVKSYGMRWNGVSWSFPINATTGSAFDRAAEIGNLLLNAGVSIRTSNQDLMDAAVASRFEPRHENWILRVHNEVKLVFPRNDEIYRTAKKIPGAHWQSGTGMLIPSDSVDEIMDFAERMDFRIAPLAQELLDQAAMRKHTRKVVDPAPAAVHLTEKEELNAILSSSREVLEDLKDD